MYGFSFEDVFVEHASNADFAMRFACNVFATAAERLIFALSKQAVGGFSFNSSSNSLLSHHTEFEVRMKFSLRHVLNNSLAFGLVKSM